MALQAGRVGVHPSQVDILGKIKKSIIAKMVAPWQKKGAWYEIVLNYDSTRTNKLQVVTTDFPEHIGFNNADIYLGTNNSWNVLNVISDGVPTAPYYDNRYGTRNGNVGLSYLGTSTPMNNWKTGNYTFKIYVYAYKGSVNSPALLSDNPVQSVRKVAKASKVDEPVEEITEPIEEPINTDTE